MFTQCSNCKAIFNVNMREIAVSKGFLRCGECHEVFDASENLSTTMQEPFKTIDTDDETSIEPLKAIDPDDETSIENLRKKDEQTASTLDEWQQGSTAFSEQEQIDISQSLRQSPTAETETSKYTPKGYSHATAIGTGNNTTLRSKLSLYLACSLGLLLILQLGYNYRHLILGGFQYQPEKMQMLNHNVFAHPIEKNVLLISASIENTAEFDQKFPILEVRLTNSKAELMALGRFSPNEYLDNYSAETIFIKKSPVSIKLKIKDPGKQATRFQFDFL